MDSYEVLVSLFKDVAKKYNVIEKLKYGDVIWAYADKSDNFNFEGRHQLRPFTVLYKDDKYIYALSHTHHRNIGVQGYFVSEKMRNVLINEIIKIEYKNFKNRFNGKYTTKQLDGLSRCISKLYKSNKKVLEAESKSISLKIGDLVLLNEEKYIVKKINDRDVSLLKLVDKNRGEINFNYNGKNLYVLKDAVVVNASYLTFIDEFGEKIIEAFEAAKRLIKVKEISKYEIGSILEIENEEKIIIDIYEKFLILIDKDRKCSHALKKDTYKIVGKISAKEVKQLRRRVDYSKIARSNILLTKKNR